jgi:structure-specific endonuclease subunit SLX1
MEQQIQKEEERNEEKKVKVKTEKEAFVYLLVSSDNATYVGSTVNLDRRLRQHNKELAGGAHATTCKVIKGETWLRACHISGFPDWSSALQFEWRWKQLSRKQPVKIFPLKRRALALKELLSLEKSTTKAIPFSEWNPVIHMELDEMAEYYNE